MPEQPKIAASGEMTGTAVARRRRTAKVSATINQVKQIKIFAEQDIGINVYQLQTAQGAIVTPSQNSVRCLTITIAEM